MGTPSYMAPEQAEGRSAQAGPTADVYSLGAILYEMLTGRPPFTAESPMATFMLLLQMEPVRPSQLQPRIPRDLETICLKCLHKLPHRRYASADELAADLQRFLAGEPIRARPATLCEKVCKWGRRRPALAMLAACSVLTVCCFFGLILWSQVHLQARLGQALQDEREARQAQEEAGEREHLARLRHKVEGLLQAGEAALLAGDWHKARLQLARARDQASDVPELSELKARIEQHLLQAEQRHFDQERLRKFLQAHNDALFHATLFTGTDLATSVHDTRRAALAALALFGVTPDSTDRPTVDRPGFGNLQQTEIIGACYELLLLLADALAQPLPEQHAGDQRENARQALRALDHAASLGISTQAYHRRRASFLALLGQAEGAGQERLRAATIHPSTALDHFLIGEERFRHGDLEQARLAFENVLQVQPGHFWASYYLALCLLKAKRPDHAAARLTACLGQRRDFPWLYLLRASAWGDMGSWIARRSILPQH
jgi:tetratricopeptide (TPR) repeat protein